MRLLELGALEYLQKPVSAQEILLRIRNIISFLKSRPVKSGNALIKIAGVTIDLTTRCISDSAGGKPIELTGSELKLLTVLGEAGDAAFSRDRLFAKITGRRILGASRAMDMLVSKLRRKLREGHAPVDIYSVRGQGYVLRARGD